MHAYHDHLDVCAQCREHPWSLCPTGAALLMSAVTAPQICTCGHPRTAHAPRLPAPCRHGLTMPDNEIIARACDPTLTEDPRYGCRCVGFCPATS